jgi:tRNA pseudouridine55 synthase
MPNRHAPDAEGLLNLDKPLGLTSHDVVARVRRLTHIARVGHAGTLDPRATGVLLIGLGKGTKLTPFLHEYRKTYRALLKLGVRTDSRDAAGQIIAVKPVEGLSAAAVRVVLAGFEGTIEQIPPMHSAVKWQGQRLYTLARQGIEVDRQPRPVQIFCLQLLALTADTLSLEVECSAGTYIRVLADDIGQRLGCGAHLIALSRTAIGPFRLTEALTLSAFEAAVHEGRWHHHLMSLASAAAAFPALIVTSPAAHALRHGIPPRRQEIAHIVGTFETGDTVAVLGSDGSLLAMATPTFRAAELHQVAPEVYAVRLRRVFVEAGRGEPPPSQRPPLAPAAVPAEQRSAADEPSA